MSRCSALSESPDHFFQTALVIIPAHNEEEGIAVAVQRLNAAGFARIRVVDNGSRDRTAAVAQAAGAEVLQIPGRGYGLACWVGAEGIPAGVEWLVYANADASDELEAYPRFASLSSDYDLLLGARVHPEDRYQFTPAQRFGNWLAPFLIKCFWGWRFADLGPQRAIRVAAYRRLQMKDRGFGWTVEMQARAVEEGLRILEIPVRSHPRVTGQSKISGTWRGTITAGVIILWTLAKLVGRRLVGHSTNRKAGCFR